MNLNRLHVQFCCYTYGLAVLLALAGCQHTHPSRTSDRVHLQWEALPDLPPAPGEAEQLGLGGALVGVIGDTLIVAGGSNFPEGAPWDGGAKVYYDQVYVLSDTDDRWHWTVDAGHTLPGKLAYSGVVEVDEGLV